MFPAVPKVIHNIKYIDVHANDQESKFCWL